MNVSESAELLKLFPAEIRDNIKYVAVDSTGHRAGYFKKPSIVDGYWFTDQPYYVVDEVDPAGWRDSLVRIERDISIRGALICAGIVVIILMALGVVRQCA